MAEGAANDWSQVGHPDTTHPLDIVGHLTHGHGLRPQPGTPLDVLYLAHAQRHGGFGVGADHAPDEHLMEEDSWL